MLLRSWVAEAGLAERVAWVPAGRDERDPQRFWLSVLGALRETIARLGAGAAADGGAGSGRLGDRGAAAGDLAPLTDRIWLVIDDVHELSPDTLRQLELLVMRAPPGCGSCWPPGMTCGWACTGCGWKAS